MPVHRKLRYVSKHNKLVQLVVQVQYHVNVIHSLGGGHTHTHTDIVDKSNFKKPGARRPKGRRVPGLTNSFQAFPYYFIL